MSDLCQHAIETEASTLRRTLVFLGGTDKLPRDPIFQRVFQFCEIDCENITVFTRLGGEFPDFLGFLYTYSDVYFRTVLIFTTDEAIALWNDLQKVPIPWEAFRVFLDGRFSRIEAPEPNNLKNATLESWAYLEEVYE